MTNRLGAVGYESLAAVCVILPHLSADAAHEALAAAARPAAAAADSACSAGHRLA